MIAKWPLNGGDQVESVDIDSVLRDSAELSDPVPTAAPSLQPDVKAPAIVLHSVWTTTHPSSGCCELFCLFATSQNRGRETSVTTTGNDFERS